MKKLLVLLGALAIISTTSLAWGGYGNNGGGRGTGCGGFGFFSGMRNGWHHMTGRGYDYSQATPEDQRAYIDARERNLEVYNKYSVEISQKQLDVERELLEEKPDWKKIGKLNEEIARLQAQARTEQMKNNY